MFAICEVPLPNGRRADMVAIDAEGLLTIVEIKVSRADLLGDGKWCDYLDYCDYFYWAVPAGFGLAPFEGDGFGPDCAGLIVADRYDAEVIRPAPHRPLAAAAPQGRDPALRPPRRAAARRRPRSGARRAVTRVGRGRAGDAACSSSRRI